MRKSTQEKIRAALRAEQDGLTSAQISRLVDVNPQSIAGSLKCMPDAYIDRWETKNRTKYISAVWCVVVPPENCPKPNPKKSK